MNPDVLLAAAASHTTPLAIVVNACILLRRNNFDPPDRIACPSYS